MMSCKQLADFGLKLALGHRLLLSTKLLRERQPVRRWFFSEHPHRGEAFSFQHLGHPPAGEAVAAGVASPWTALVLWQRKGPAA